MLKRVIKKVRDFYPVNIAVTGVVRRLVQEPSAFLIRYLPRTGVVEAALPNGRTLRLWSRADDLTASPVYWRGWDGYETDTARAFFDRARSARVTLDIGAHVGYFSLLAGLANPDGRVFAFEPNPPVLARLRRNIELNGLTNVEAVPRAVGATTGRGTFYFVPDESVPTNSSLSLEYISVCERVANITVELVAIDDFVSERGLAAVDLVKVDTETTEAAVLEGMRGTLERFRPTVLCEILSAQAEQRIRSVLEPLGYRSTLVGADSRNYLFAPA